MDFTPIEEGISAATGTPFRIENRQGVGGGCINEAVRVEGCGQRYFVKLNEPALLPMFEAEAAGLEVMAASETIRVPRPVVAGADAAKAWLVLEHIEFGASGSATSALLGEQLAAMHRTSADQFGWERDNTIGSTPQPNTPCGNWVDFWRERRLGYQLHLASANGAGQLLDEGERLMAVLPAFFSGYHPLPSLLHGDLWGGNWGADTRGRPVIFDPATYFGDRESDLAMTELFGGFDDRFYHSYGQAWTLDPGYGTRKVLYNLYHILNHYNLFGGGYAAQAGQMIRQLLAEVA